MSTTYERESATATPVVPNGSRPAAAALAVGTVLTAAALALHLRGGIDDVAFVRRVEDAPGTWLAGHVLMGVGGLLLLQGLLAVPRLVRGHGRRAVVIATGLSAVGAAATALGDFAHGTLAYVLVGDVPAEQSLRLQEQFFAQPLIAAVTMPGLLLPLGVLLLGGALLRSRAVPTPAALLVLVAPVAIQLGYAVTSLPMVVMVLPLLVGLGWLSHLLARQAR